MGDAPEPSDVQFEHIEYGPWERAGRVCLVAAASYGALALGFLLISLASTLRLDASRVRGWAWHIFFYHHGIGLQ